MATKKSSPPAQETPAQVTLTHPYAFYDENEQLQAWSAGQIVTDADEIATLVERGAPLAE